MPLVPQRVLKKMYIELGASVIRVRAIARLNERAAAAQSQLMKKIRPCRRLWGFCQVRIQAQARLIALAAFVPWSRGLAR